MQDEASVLGWPRAAAVGQGKYVRGGGVFYVNGYWRQVQSAGRPVKRLKEVAPGVTGGRPATGSGLLRRKSGSGGLGLGSSSHPGVLGKGERQREGGAAYRITSLSSPPAGRWVSPHP